MYLLGKKSAFSALDFIHIKARARVESAPSFSRRVVSRVLLLLEKHSFLYRERHAHVYIYRERESAQRSKADKKVKSNLSGKEKNPRETSLSLSLSLSFPFFVASRDESEKESRDFFHRSKEEQRVCFFSFIARCSKSATRFGSVLSVRGETDGRELGPEEGG